MHTTEAMAETLSLLVTLIMCDRVITEMALQERADGSY